MADSLAQRFGFSSLGFVCAFEGFELPEQPQVVRAEARFLARELFESVDGVVVGFADEVRIRLERAKAGGAEDHVDAGLDGGPVVGCFDAPEAAEFPNASGEFLDEEVRLGGGGLILVEKRGLEFGEIVGGFPEFGDRFGGGSQGTVSEGVA